MATVAAPAPRVWACAICFEAAAADIKPLLTVLEPQVERILLVDNSPEFDRGLAQLATDRIMHVPMTANRGTAGAVNEAWRRADGAGVEFLITFDQDSRPDPRLVEGLIASVTRLANTGWRVAAIGPRKVDPRTGVSIRLLRPLRYIRRYVPADVADPVEAYHLLTPG